jgi:hypothetical protein
LVVCPWCKHDVQLSFQSIEGTPESSYVSRVRLAEIGNAREVEAVNCPTCRKVMHVFWYGGFRI